MTAHSAHAIAFVLVSVMLAGCAQDGTLLTGSLNTASIDQTQQQPKQNPLCVTLASQIEALNKEGVSAKLSKAAAKKYKLKQSDLAKADELNKANGEFQAKCSEYPPAPVVAETEPEQPAAHKVAKKIATPPVPAQKPVASAAMMPAATGSIPQSQPAAPAAAPSP
jgi:hypothetical protein